MQLKFKKVNTALIVRIEGELDHHMAVEIRDKIDREISKHAVRNLIFDFEKLNFMDSSGIGVILGRYKLIQRMEGKACLVHLNPQVTRIIHVSGIHKIIPVYSSINEALKEL